MCEADLNVWVEPKASLTVSGSASLNLLVVDASTALTFSANGALRPKAHVSGTVCDAGLELDFVRDPADTASLVSAYSVRKCKMLLVGCETIQRRSETWWSWEDHTQTIVLANKPPPIRI